MNVSFSNRMQGVSPSAIREILKYSSDPQVISFAAGNPSSESFPIQFIQEQSARIFAENPIGALQYSISEGLPALRDHLKSFLKERYQIGDPAYDELIVTSGAQQALEILPKVLCNEGDVVLCEDPSFVGALNAFRSYGVRPVGVAMDEDGINIEKLEEAIKREKKAKFLYTIPNFQNPTGRTMSLEKRKRLYALAEKYDLLIVEDNPYGDLRYRGESLPPIKAFDQKGLVIYLGSFSKILSPGLRVGYVLGHKDILPKMVICKQISDVHANIFAQLLCDAFLTRYDVQGHIDSIKELYRHKSGLMLEALDREFGDTVTHTNPEGGMFIWCTLPDGVDMPTFCTEAVRDFKVAVVPGNTFSMSEDDPCQSFRLNFTTPSDEAIEKGIHVLAELVKSKL